MTRPQKIARWTAVVDAIVADYRRLDSACTAALKAGAMDPDGPLHDAIWRSFERMLSLVDLEGWIAWHIWDNQCGKKRGKSKAHGHAAFRVIHTSRQLARLLVEAEDAKANR